MTHMERIRYRIARVTEAIDLKRDEIALLGVRILTARPRSAAALAPLLVEYDILCLRLRSMIRNRALMRAALRTAERHVKES